MCSAAEMEMEEAWRVPPTMAAPVVGVEDPGGLPRPTDVRRVAFDGARNHSPVALPPY